MKKKILSLSALICLVMSGCNLAVNSSSNSETSSNSVVETSSSSVKTSSSESNKISSITISNKNVLTATWYEGGEDRTLDIALVASGVTLDQAISKNLITITSSDATVVKAVNKKLSALKPGTATITVAAGEVKDSVEITVSEKVYENPVITITPDESKTYGTVSGQELELPGFTCVDNYGTDLSAYVTITSDLDPYATIYNNKFLSDIEGSHTLTYSVKHPNNEEKVGTATFTVDVYRKIFAREPSVCEISDLATNENQKVTLKDPGETVSQLNLPVGKVYYAEANFEGPTYNIWGGFAHVTSNYTEPARWLLSCLRNSDKTSIWLDSSNWATSSDRYHNNINDTMGIAFDGTSVKVATARINHEFYLFINDTYVGSYSNEYYASVDTAPGIFMNAYGAGASVLPSYWMGETLMDNGVGDGVDVTNIDFFSDAEEVQAKVETLMAGRVVQQYIPSSVGQWGYEYRPDIFSSGESEEKGVYMDVLDATAGQNASIWSPWVYFGGDMTFEFDYTYGGSTVDESSQDGRMWVELRGWDHSTTLVEFGAKYSMADPQFMMDQEQYCNSYGDSEEGVQKYNQPTVSSIGLTKDAITTLHYKITRELVEATGTKAAHSKITMTITLDGVGSISHTVYAYSGRGANEELLVLVQNKNVKGSFTNIKWSHSIEAESPEITA